MTLHSGQHGATRQKQKSHTVLVHYRKQLPLSSCTQMRLKR